MPPADGSSDESTKASSIASGKDDSSNGDDENVVFKVTARPPAGILANMVAMSQEARDKENAVTAEKSVDGKANAVSDDERSPPSKAMKQTSAEKRKRGRPAGKSNASNKKKKASKSNVSSKSNESKPPLTPPRKTKGASTGSPRPSPARTQEEAIAQSKECGGHKMVGALREFPKKHFTKKEYEGLCEGDIFPTHCFGCKKPLCDNVPSMYPCYLCQNAQCKHNKCVFALCLPCRDDRAKNEPRVGRTRHAVGRLGNTLI